jgi:hypothetical protein
MLCLTPDATPPTGGVFGWHTSNYHVCIQPAGQPGNPRTPSYFVVTCTARLYLPSLLHAYAHAFVTSSYTSNYLVCIQPVCCLINKRATPLQRYQSGFRQIFTAEARPAASPPSTNWSHSICPINALLQTNTRVNFFLPHGKSLVKFWLVKLPVSVQFVH